MKTSIVIWTCNQLAATTQCIENIRQYTGSQEYELIVVDDHSVDGTPEWLKNQPDLKVIYNEKRRGYPQSCNQGIALASGDNILLLENDVVVSHSWLNNLICCLYSSKEIGAVSPVANIGAYYQAIPVTYQTMDEMHAHALKHNHANPAAWEERLKLTGYCLLLKKSVVDEAGLLDEAFIHGPFVDDDYSFRIRQAGYRLFLCKDTFVHHAGDAHFNTENVTYGEALKINRDHFSAKWGFDSQYSTWIRWEIIALVDKPRTQPIKVLEIGCACGGTLLQIKNTYPQAILYGIELNEQASASARQFADVIAADIEKAVLPYPEEFFDYIILADVLEHLENPWRALENIKRYLQQGGQILASIPNVMHFSVLRNLLQGNWIYEAAGILDKTHLRFFTLNQIKSMFEDAGYKVTGCQSTFIHETAGDQQFIEALAAFAGNAQLAAQYRTYQYIVKAFKPVVALPVPRRNQAPNANKICFITWVNDDTLYQRCRSYIDNLAIPAGYEVELLPIKDGLSMASAYNQANGQSDAKYKIYLHQDVFIIHKYFLQDVLNIFQNPRVGLIGVAGSGQIPTNGIWWESGCNFGKVYDSHSGAMRLVAFQEVSDDYQEVQCIDGLIMITQYDLPWREDLFTGWHFYDLSQSMEFSRAAYKVVVPRQGQPWCIHDSGVINLTAEYDDYRRIFVNEYLSGSADSPTSAQGQSSGGDE